jgi:integrase/recombinase XerD
MTDDEFIRLLLLMDTSKFHEFRVNIIIQLLFDTGMRIGECISINVADVMQMPAEQTDYLHSIVLTNME